MKLLLIAALTLSSIAQVPVNEKLFTFEGEHTGTMPAGWNGGPPSTIAVDDKIVHSDKWSVRLQREAESPQAFTTITYGMPIAFGGTRVELKGFLKTEDVAGWSGLWLRQDGDRLNLAFDNMQKRELKGTTDWTEYAVVLPLHSEAKQLYFGVLLAGTGKTWADDLQLLVDGKPISQAPKRVEPETVLSRDREFDNESKVVVNDLTRVQIENLALLGKVWGFLKYHHPRVTAGEIHWDHELFRVLPAILAATDKNAAQGELQSWIAKLGPIENCTQCAVLKDDSLHLRPQLEWLSATGPKLGATLLSIHKNRGTKPFYVGQFAGVGNPIFNNEPAYATIKSYDTGYQLLALFRFWNIIEYWFPYGDIIGADWHAVLEEFVPRIALAKAHETYPLEMIALITRVNDTHANLWSTLYVRPPGGDCLLPIALRFIGSDAVVTAFHASPLLPGDIIESIDGVPVAKSIAQWTPYYAASNEPTRLRDIARSLTRGDCKNAVLLVRRGARSLDLKMARVRPETFKMPMWHDQPGDTFRKLSNDVAYLKLSSVKSESAASYIEGAAGTKGLVIDIRNYPSAFTVFALGSLLVDKPTEFVRFTKGDLANPGAFHWTPALSLQPDKPHYEGKVVVLLDEVSQSSAEYTSMAFRASPRAKVIGSTTAGADGNISQIMLPGNLRTMISGIGVFYPDKRPTQRVGIIPDIEVKPTIEGIREGRDELLERAIREIVGDSVPAAEIEKLARPAH